MKIARVEREVLRGVIADALDVSNIHPAVPISMEDRIADAVIDWLAAGCLHCGRLPEADGDHSCPCPLSDSECLEHTLNPVTTTAEAPDGE